MFVAQSSGRRICRNENRSMNTIQIAGEKHHPVAFISSFTRELDGCGSHRDSPLWRLRQDLADLNHDESFIKSLPMPAPRTLTWIAERSGEQLDQEPDKMAVVD